MVKVTRQNTRINFKRQRIKEKKMNFKNYKEVFEVNRKESTCDRRRG